MGLMDILNGMQNGPRGQRQPTPPGQGSRMSPILTALIGLLAYKAIQGGGLGNIFGGNAPAAPPPALPPGTRADGGGGGLGDILGGMLGGNAGRSPGATPGGGGGLGDILGGMLGGGRPGGGMAPGNAGGGGLGDILGGLLGGAGAGSVLNGGLGQVVNDLQRSGHGGTAQSWIGTGENESIAPDDLARALGADTIEQLGRETGMGRDELLEGLSQNLPDLVNQLTPEGRLPTEEEAKQW